MTYIIDRVSLNTANMSLPYLVRGRVNAPGSEMDGRAFVVQMQLNSLNHPRFDFSLTSWEGGAR